MKKIRVNVFLTSVALAVGVCSLASMPRGRALNERGRFVARGLSTECSECEEKGEACFAAQPIPTTWGKVGDQVLICSGTPRLKRYAVWSNTKKVDYESDVVDCQGTYYTFVIIGTNGYWRAGTPVYTSDCGTYTECNGSIGWTGWSGGKEEYMQYCNDHKPDDNE
ncbi:MAG TPA: hypothetical protein P5026_10625 [Kiritimatiellia bacterium]|nr:hypothetical protein [Kiritimatiellia bacterium]